MSSERSTFISEPFWTADGRFQFQVVGLFYNLYDRENEYRFVKEFRSFKAMQDYMNEMRKGNAETEKRTV